MVRYRANRASLASLQAPRSNFQWRPDGNGIIDVRSISAYGVQRVNLTTGATTRVLPGERTSPFALTADGVLLRGEKVDGRIRVTSVVVATGARRTITLPAEIERVESALANGTQLLAFGAETQQPPLQNRFSVNQRMRPAFLVDRMTGTTRRIADTVFWGCCPRNWGSNESAVGFAEQRNGVVNINVFDAAGNTRMLFSFPTSMFGRLRDISVHRERIAFVDSVGPGSASVFVAEGAGPARAVFTFSHEGDPALAWSPDGRKLAIAYGDAADGGRAMVRVLDVSADGTVSTTGRSLDLGGTTSYVETLLWLPDQSALIVNRDEAGNGLSGLVLRPLDASQPSVRVGGATTGQFFLEPSGRTLLSISSAPGGAAIWTVPFTPIPR